MILFKYILKNHLVPFLFSVATLISIFLLQFLMKHADRLVGKGLSIWVITKLIAYNLGWILVLVVPMAVLVSTLMAFGNMAQNNEVSIMKSTGLSLYKMMIPPFLGSIFVAFMLVQFNNHVYPDTNHQLKYLLRDISRKKPTLSLVPGVFSQEVKNYSILSREINPLTNELKDLTIYDKSDPKVMNVITAEDGKIFFAPSQKKLIMDLYNGEIHQYDITKKVNYQILEFDNHKIAMPGDQFTFQESESTGRRGNRELGAAELKQKADSLTVIRNKYLNQFQTFVSKDFIQDSLSYEESKRFAGSHKKHVYLKVEDKIKSAKRNVKNKLKRIENKRNDINKYWVEVHKKYSIPFACIVFILIGAPLGTMTRKGGFGVAAGISLLFFVIYWAFLIGGEKLADRGLLSPFWGMWSANFVLGFLGIYLTVKSAKEKVTLDFSFFQKILPKKFRKLDDENS